MDEVERYKYRSDNHLCVKCGDKLPPEQTLKECDICRKFTHLRQNARYAKRSDEWKANHKAYMKRWWKEHPERVKEYRKRRKNNG